MMEQVVLDGALIDVSEVPVGREGDVLSLAEYVALTDCAPIDAERVAALKPASKKRKG